MGCGKDIYVEETEDGLKDAVMKMDAHIHDHVHKGGHKEDAIISYVDLF